MTTQTTTLACNPKNYLLQNTLTKRQKIFIQHTQNYLLQNTLTKNIEFQNKYDNAVDHEKYRVSK